MASDEMSTGGDSSEEAFSTTANVHVALESLSVHKVHLAPCRSAMMWKVCMLLVIHYRNMDHYNVHFSLHVVI